MKTIDRFGMCVLHSQSRTIKDKKARGMGAGVRMCSKDMKTYSAEEGCVLVNMINQYDNKCMIKNNKAQLAQTHSLKKVLKAFGEKGKKANHREMN